MKKASKLFMIAGSALALAVVPAVAQHGGGPPTMSHGPSSMHGMSANHNSGKPQSSPKTSGKSVNELLEQNKSLSSKLENLLKLTGDSASQLQQLEADAQGFRNLGQFVAAVHVSNNLGIPFDQLKSTMMGPPKKSLGQAIHDLKPDISASAETKKANRQAKGDLKDSHKAS